MSTNLKENAEIIKSVFVMPCQPKSLDVAMNIAGVERKRSENMRLRSTLRTIRLEFWMKGALVSGEICVLCGSWSSNQIDIVSEMSYSNDAVGREL